MSLSRNLAKISIGSQEESVPTSQWCQKEKDFGPGNCTSSVGSSQLGISLAEPGRKEQQSQDDLISGIVINTLPKQISSTSIDSPAGTPITGMLNAKTN